MKIGVIGAGRLGITFALLCEQAGFEVLVSDVRQDYIDNLNKKLIRTNEPGVLELLQKTKKFSATTDNVKVIEQCDVVYTFVSTPSKPTGEYDITYLMDVVHDWGWAFENEIPVFGKIFVIGCTTNPGDTRKIMEILNPMNIDVCYNPEFIAQGEIIKGLEQADMVLIGSTNQNSVNILSKIYSKIQTIPVKINSMSSMAAEVTKISINCFLTTKISYANLIGEILTTAGLSDEIKLVLHSIGNDSRVGSKYLNYGFGFGGPCLPRDNRALGHFASALGLKVNLPYAVDDFNEYHSQFLRDHWKTINPDKNIPFVMNHITYKRGTDMLVESQQLRLMYDLLNDGYSINIIECDYILNDRKLLSELSNDFGNRVKFYKEGSKPEGIPIQF